MSNAPPTASLEPSLRVAVPAKLLKDGDYAVVIRMNQREPVFLSFLDVAIRKCQETLGFAATVT